MIFGSPFSSGFGDPERQIKVLLARLVNSGSAIRVQFEPTTGYENSWWGLYVNGQRAKVVYVTSGLSQAFDVPVPTGCRNSSLAVFHQGGLKDCYLNAQAALYESTARQVTATWTWIPEILDALDGSGELISFLSSWVLTGLSKDQLNTVNGFATRGAFVVTVTVAGGTATVSLEGNGATLAQGSGSYPGTVTLAAVGDSGLSGSMDVASGAASVIGALYVRFPAAMQVKRALVNPPNVIAATIPFNGQATKTWTDKQLAGNTYYYSFTPISDTGETGTTSAISTAVVPATPAPPTGISYLSGNAAAIVLQFTPSTTTGATYRGYIQKPGDLFMDMGQTPATAAAGASEITLSAITGYPGAAYALVRAVKSGVEERNGELVTINLDASGNYVALAPNAPNITKLSCASGTTVTVAASYVVANEQATPTKIQVFSRTPDGSYNYSSPDFEATLGAALRGIRSANGSDTYADGWRFFTARAATAAGTQSTDAPEQEFYVSDAAAAQPTVTVRVARG